MKKRFRLAIFALVGALCLCFSLAACGGKGTTADGDPAEPVPPVTDPSGGQPEESGSSTPKRSGILRSVLASSYYNNLINQYKQTDKIIYYIFHYNILQAAPYGFFEQQGHDIDGIKQNESEFYSNMYIKNDEPNNLYIATNVETKTADSDYYNNYLLKYSITDEEIKDLEILYYRDYIEANFFIQELSYVKTPTVVSKFKIDVATYDGLLTALNKKSGVQEALSYKNINAININSIKVNPDNQLEHFVNIDFIASKKNSKNIHSSTIGNFNIITRFVSGLSYNDNVLKINWTNRFRLDPNTNIQDSLTETTTYQMADWLAHLDFKQ